MGRTVRLLVLAAWACGYSLWVDGVGHNTVSCTDRVPFGLSQHWEGDSTAFCPVLSPVATAELVSLWFSTDLYIKRNHGCGR